MSDRKRDSRKTVEVNFLKQANRAYAALRKNPEAWRAEQEEREAWDATLSDGLKVK